jgi:multidrug efflux pump subunit AcrA (membrane-fusion protein)
VQNDTVRLQLVKTGQRTDERAEVLSGLAEGDLVVVSDSRELSDGRKIIVQEQ